MCKDVSRGLLPLYVEKASLALRFDTFFLLLNIYNKVNSNEFKA